TFLAPPPAPATRGCSAPRNEFPSREEPQPFGPNPFGPACRSPLAIRPQELKGVWHVRRRMDPMTAEFRQDRVLAGRGSLLLRTIFRNPIVRQILNREVRHRFLLTWDRVPCNAFTGDRHPLQEVSGSAQPFLGDLAEPPEVDFAGAEDRQGVDPDEILGRG